MSGASNERPGAGEGSEIDEFTGGADQLFRWAASVRGALTVGDVLALNTLQTDLPPSQQRLWNRLASLPIQGREPVEPVLAKQLAHLLGSVESENLAIYLRRIDPIDPVTPFPRSLGHSQETFSRSLVHPGTLLNRIIAAIRNRTGAAMAYREIFLVNVREIIRRWQDG